MSEIIPIFLSCDTCEFEVEMSRAGIPEQNQQIDEQLAASGATTYDERVEKVMQGVTQCFAQLEGDQQADEPQLTTILWLACWLIWNNPAAQTEADKCHGIVIAVAAGKFNLGVCEDEDEYQRTIREIRGADPGENPLKPTSIH